MTSIDLVSRLTKSQLLDLLEEIPQGYWPPRPTRQDKETLTQVIRQALYDGKLSIDRVQQLVERK